MAGNHVGHLQEDDQWRGIHRRIEGKTIGGTGLTDIKHSHVPPDSQQFLAVQTQVVVHDMAGFLTVAEGKLVIHLVTGVTLPFSGIVLAPTLNLAVDVALANVVEQCDNGDALGWQALLKQALATVLPWKEHVLIDLQGGFKDIDAVLAQAARCVQMKLRAGGGGEEVRTVNIGKEAFQTVALDILAAIIEILLPVLLDFELCHILCFNCSDKPIDGRFP